MLLSLPLFSHGEFTQNIFSFVSFRNHDTLRKTIIQALSVAIAKLPKEISRSRHSNQHHQRRLPSLALPPTSIPTYVTILVLYHGGFPGDYHMHAPITRRPMCKPKDRHKPGIKLWLRSSAHTSLGPCRHMATTHLKPEHYTSTWVPNTSQTRAAFVLLRYAAERLPSLAGPPFSNLGMPPPRSLGTIFPVPVHPSPVCFPMQFGVFLAVSATAYSMCLKATRPLLTQAGGQLVGDATAEALAPTPADCRSCSW